MGEVAWGRSAEDTQEIPPVRPSATRRRIYGRVYETIERGQRDGEHRYVGMTEKTLHQRVHGPNGHTSAASVAKDPWKTGILPGKAGYRLLENVYDTGDPAENGRALRRAEAAWIDRYRPARNVVRPVRPPAGAPQPPRRAPRPAPEPRTRRATADERRRLRVRRRLFAMAWLVVICATAMGFVARALDLPHPIPLLAAAAGALIGSRLFHSLLAYYRKLARA